MDDLSLCFSCCCSHASCVGGWPRPIYFSPAHSRLTSSAERCVFNIQEADAKSARGCLFLSAAGQLQQ
eukprot:4210672-Amphidinium_carterae.1